MHNGHTAMGHTTMGLKQNSALFIIYLVVASFFSKRWDSVFRFGNAICEIHEQLELKPERNGDARQAWPTDNAQKLCAMIT
jgi:hypothetical protein